MLSVMLVVGCDRDPKPVVIEPTEPEAPTTQPATRPAEVEPTPIVVYHDLLLEAEPDLPTTRPADVPLPTTDAAAVVLTSPHLVDSRGVLWLSHPNGQPIDDVARDPEAWRESEFVTDQRARTTRVAFRGEDRFLEVLTANNGRVTWHHATGAAEAELSAARWDDAIGWKDALAVPTEDGVALLRLVDVPDDPKRYERRYGGLPIDQRPDPDGTIEVLATPPTPADDWRLMPAGDAIIAWSGTADSVQLFKDGTWQSAGDDWSADALHFVPYVDGSVLQVMPDGTLALLSLSPKSVDANEIAMLVGELGNFDPDRRDAAFARLAQLGPAAREPLVVLYDDARPLAQRAIDTLLGYGDQPTLGGFLPLPGKASIVTRLPGFGVVMHFEGGVEYEEAAGIGVVKQPAHLLVRPGSRIRLLDRALVDRLDVGDTLVGIGGDIVVVGDDGPESWGVNHFRRLLPDDLATDWPTPIARDSRGRWLFAGESPGKLLVDTRLPAASTSIASWVLETGTAGPLQVPGMAGRGPEGWPTMQLGGAWRLAEFGWESLADDTRVERSADTPPVEAELGGATYQLIDRSLLRDGTPIAQVDAAPGTAEPVVLHAGPDGKLYAFPGNGTVLQITIESEKPETKVHEDLLPIRDVRLVWTDPAGRVCVAFGNDKVAVLWVDGQVSPEIRQLMPIQRRTSGRPDQ
ncbi:MAG: hypothetical protein AAGI46_14965, partial [Planctomycetota bacterium]